MSDRNDIDDANDIIKLLLEIRQDVKELKRKRGRNKNKEGYIAETLQNYPELQSFFPELCELIKKVHPKADINNNPSAQELAMLAAKDNYSQSDIIACFRWLFTSSHERAAFWSSNVRSMTNIRRRKPGDSMSKFDKLFESYEDANGKGTRIASRDHSCRFNDDDDFAQMFAVREIG